MNVKLGPDFFKQLKSINIKIRKSFKEKILIFAKNPYDLNLNNHELKREYEGYRSIDITADYRAIYEEIDTNTAYFFLIGIHKQLYGKTHNKN